MAIPKLKSNKPPVVEDEPKQQGQGKSFADLYDETEEASGFSNPPDGTYQALLFGAAHFEKEGDETVAWECVIVNDEDKLNGKKFNIRYIVWKDDCLGPGMPYFKKDLTLLGVDPLKIKSVKDLHEQMQDIAETQIWFEVVAKTKKGSDFQNYFIQKAFEDQDEKPECPTPF